MGLSDSRDYSWRSILSKYYINFSTPSLCGQKPLFSSEHYNDENIHIRVEMEVVEKKERTDLTGAEEEEDAKSFMWLDADWKHVKVILRAHGLGVGALQGSSAFQTFSFSLTTVEPALRPGWVVSDVYSISERRPVLHK